MKKLALAITALVASAQASAACTGLSCPPPTDVPEISAMDGAAAIAVVLAAVALVWERKRRV